MTTPTIQKRIARAIELKQLRKMIDTELGEIKTALYEEALSRPLQEREPTEGGGWSWRFTGEDRQIVCVTQPGDKLKSTLNPESKGFEKIKEAAGKAWSFLFVQVPAYKPKDDFRNLAVAHLGRNAKRLIKLVTSDSSVTVSFEVAESEATA